MEEYYDYIAKIETQWNKNHKIFPSTSTLPQPNQKLETKTRLAITRCTLTEIKSKEPLNDLKNKRKTKQIELNKNN